MPSAKQLLSELGVWDAFRAAGHLPCYGNASAWGSDTLRYTDFIRSPWGHGWHLDRARFDAMLRDAACDAGATILRNARFVNAHRDRGRWRVQLADSALHCDWLVDCGGRTAPVARANGVARTYDDALVAIYARFEAEGSDSLTLVESASDGWWHTALLPGGERIATFFTDTIPPDARTACGFASLVDETLHVRERLAGAAIAGVPRAVDARSGRLEQLRGERWLAAGDAAIAFDPLSAQGILSAMYEGKKAAEAILENDLPRYEERLETIYARFLAQRNAYYASERRWQDRPFWQARAAVS